MGPKPVTFRVYAKFSQKISSTGYEPAVDSTKTCRADGIEWVQNGMRDVIMHKTITKAVAMLLYMLVLLPLAGLAPTAHAQSADNDIDSLLIIPAANGKADLAPLQTRLEFAAGAAFMDISILPIDPDFMPAPNNAGDATTA